MCDLQKMWKFYYEKFLLKKNHSTLKFLTLEI